MVLLVIYNISLEMTGMSYCKSSFWFERAGSLFKHKSIVRHDYVTTVPLSVSYGGAKPLGPWLRTSNFVPCG